MFLAILLVLHDSVGQHIAREQEEDIVQDSEGRVPAREGRA